MVYEGEYLNEKRNGKGKEYECQPGGNPPILVYDGEFKDGERVEFCNNLNVI